MKSTIRACCEFLEPIGDHSAAAKHIEPRLLIHRGGDHVVRWVRNASSQRWNDFMK
jgi:hypothetical protein